MGLRRCITIRISYLEALYFASPSLIERLDEWRAKPDSKAGRKVEASLLKYLIRMTSRPTPFGLFSGIALGHLSNSSNLTPSNLVADVRKTRLDIFYLSTIQNQWAQSQEGLTKLNYVPNTTLFRFGSVLHYIEFCQVSSQRKYRLSSVEFDDVLNVMLHLAERGMRQEELIDEFCRQHPETKRQDVNVYVNQLVKEQVLVPMLPLPLNSGEPDHTFVNCLKDAGNIKDIECLQEVLKKLTVLDQQSEVNVDDYRAITKQLKTLPYSVSENKLFQTDLLRAMTQFELDSNILSVLDKVLLIQKNK